MSSHANAHKRPFRSSGAPLPDELAPVATRIRDLVAAAR